MNDHDIRRQARTATLPSAIYSPSGSARCVALVLDEEIELECGDLLEFDSLSFHLVDAEIDLNRWGQQALEYYNLLLPDFATLRSLKRVLDLGLHNAHTLQKSTNSHGDMVFCCTGCGLEVQGRQTNNLFTPYEFYALSCSESRTRLLEPCIDLAPESIAV